MARLLLTALALSLASPAFAKGTTPSAPPPAPPKPGIASGAISGLVKGDDGKPFPGAEVVALHQTAKGTWKATSDANGAFSVRGIPAGDVVVVVRGRSRVPAEQKVVVPAGGVAKVEAALALGARFAGKVTDVRGAPVAGVTIEMVPAEGWTPSGAIAASTGSTPKSGPDGTFEVDGLVPGGTYSLRTRHPRFKDEEMRDLPAEAGGGNERLEVMIEDAAWVSGVVVGTDGKPVAGARIGKAGEGPAFGGIPPWLRRMLEQSGLSVGGAGPDGGSPVDAQGRFEIGSIADEEIELSAIADGYFETKWKVDGLVPGAGKADVRVSLEPATAFVEGTVVDPAGKPIANAQVDANGDVGKASETKTDAQGRFRLTKVRSRTPVLLRVSAPGRADVRKKDVALNTGGLRFTLHPSPRLRARIVDEDGNLVPTVVLTIMTQWEENDREWNSQSVEQKETGIDVPLPLGDVTVDVIAPKGRARIGEFSTEPGATIDHGLVTLEKPKGKRPASEDEEE